MPRYVVYSVTAISVDTEASNPMSAATFARNRILRILTELPVEFTSVGFEPDFHFQVREVVTVNGLGRLGEVILQGTDNDLYPR